MSYYYNIKEQYLGLCENIKKFEKDCPVFLSKRFYTDIKIPFMILIGDMNKDMEKLAGKDLIQPLGNTKTKGLVSQSSKKNFKEVEQKENKPMGLILDINEEEMKNILKSVESGDEDSKGAMDSILLFQTKNRK